MSTGSACSTRTVHVTAKNGSSLQTNRGGNREQNSPAQYLGGQRGAAEGGMAWHGRSVKVHRRGAAEGGMAWYSRSVKVHRRPWCATGHGTACGVPLPLPYRAVSCCTVSYHTRPCHAMPCHTIPYSATGRQIPRCLRTMRSMTRGRGSTVHLRAVSSYHMFILSSV